MTDSAGTQTATIGRTVALPWGTDDELRLQLPASWRAETFSPRFEAAVADVAAEVRRAVNEPIGAASLGGRTLEGRKVVVVADDHTRPTPASVVLPPVLDLLEDAGVHRPLLIPALGTHAELTDDELQQKYGSDVLARTQLQYPQARDADANVEIGTIKQGISVKVMREVAEADLVLSVGTVQPHVLAGFSGGYKNVAIGCGDMRTITRLHEIVTRRGYTQMIGRPEAPMRTAIDEAGRFLRGEVFLINCVLNGSKDVAGVYAGDPMAAFAAARQRVEAMYVADVGPPADVVLTGSFPMDLNLRQGMKCLTAGMFAVREGGVLGAFMYNRNGFAGYDPPSSPLPPRLLQGLLKLAGPQRMANLSERTLQRLNDEDKVFVRIGLTMAHRSRLLVHSPTIAPSDRRRLPFYQFCDEPQQLIDEAARRVAPDARCVVLPHGGVTYPRVTPHPG